jgi:hypothetical protein
VETEAVVVLGNQPILEAEDRTYVVDDVAPGRTEGVTGDPVGGTIVLVGLVLRQLDRQVGRAACQHAPHVAGFGTSQLAERRIGKAGIWGVAGRHRLPIPPIHGPVETFDQLS